MKRIDLETVERQMPDPFARRQVLKALNTKYAYLFNGEWVERPGGKPEEKVAIFEGDSFQQGLDVYETWQDLSRRKVYDPTRPEAILERFVAARTGIRELVLFVPWGVRPKGNFGTEIPILDQIKAEQDLLKQRGIATTTLVMPADVYATEVNRKNFVTRKANGVRAVKVTKDGKLVSDVAKILEVIQETGSVLATGHIAWKEAEILAVAARKKGIRVVLTHPIYQRIGIPIRTQKKLVRIGCFIEQCYSMYSIDKISIEEIANQIRQVGSKYVILSSDMGQTFSPDPDEALLEFAQLLLAQGITENELYVMLVENPRKLLGLERK